MTSQESNPSSVARVLGLRAVVPTCVVLLTCAVALPATASRSNRGPAVTRVVSTGGGSRPQSLELRGSTRLAQPGAVQRFAIHRIDADPYTGYENAVYAQSKTTVFVAYKKFAQDPRQQEYDPGELRVARSIDGGQTWTVTVVDAGAIEDAQVIDQTVAIDGDGQGTMYVAYHTRSSGLYASMRLMLAKSTDAGATWHTSQIIGTNCGDYTAITVLDSQTALVATHCAGALEGLYVYSTIDGGASWTSTQAVDSSMGGIDVGFDARGAGHQVLAYYASNFQQTDLHATRFKRKAGTWKDVLVDGTPGVGLTGLGASLTMPSNAKAYAAYEADNSQGTFVKVAATTDGGRTWNPVVVEQGQIIGWNTAVHTDGSGDVTTSYWWAQQQNGNLVAAQAHLGISTDGGATWKAVAVPDKRFVQPYLDSSVTGGGVRFVSYQTADSDGSNPVLKIAVMG